MGPRGANAANASPQRLGTRQAAGVHRAAMGSTRHQPPPTTTDDETDRRPRAQTDGPKGQGYLRAACRIVNAQKCFEMATNLAPKLQPKQAATYMNGSLETTAGKAPEDQCTPGLGPQTFV